MVYRNEGRKTVAAPVREALAREGADWVIFASGTAAERFRRLVPRWPVEPKVAVIGPATARKAEALKRRLINAGIYPPFIRYPGGPEGGYFRFVVSSQHTRAQLATLADALLGD